MIKIGTKFGKRGAHITVPKEWIGKEITAHLGRHMTPPKRMPETGEPMAPPVHMLRIEPDNLDEQEQDFITKWRAARTEAQRQLLRRKAEAIWLYKEIEILIKIAAI